MNNIFDLRLYQFMWFYSSYIYNENVDYVDHKKNIVIIK